MKLRKVKDPDACKALHKVILPNDEWRPRKNEQFWLMYDRDKMPVGFCSCYEIPGEPGVAFLSRSGLLACARGRALQQKMIKVRLRWAKQNGISIVVTYTSTDNAPSFYNLQACGFRLYMPASLWAGKNMLYWEKNIK